MAQRGRKSAAALTVVGGAVALDTRLEAPPTLTEAERAVWHGMVTSRPADWFASHNVPLMVEYTRLVVRGQVIADQLALIDPEQISSAEGLLRFKTLTQLATLTATAIANLATKMRLTQHSLIRAEKVIPKPGRKLWQRDPPDAA